MSLASAEEQLTTGRRCDQLTYAITPSLSLEERSTDLEEGEVSDSIELHTISNPSDYIHPNVVLQLQVAQQAWTVLYPCLKSTSIRGWPAQSVAAKENRSVTFQDKVEIREFEKYLVPYDDIASVSNSDSESDSEYEGDATLTKQFMNNLVPYDDYDQVTRCRTMRGKISEVKICRS